MTGGDNYFFIDGSALTAQIRYLRRSDKSFADRKLCPKLFTEHFMRSLRDLLLGNAYKRITFYFPDGDQTAVEKYLVMPDHNKPGEVRDLHFKFCGQKLKRSKEFLEFLDTKVPEKFKNHFNKSEKGIDIEICCDAFKLAAASRVDRLFLLTNDDDFIPFCRTMKEYGANVSIIHLSDKVTRNVSLLREADSYDVVPYTELQRIFLPPLQTPPSQEVPPTEPPAAALKEDAPPSDMEVETPIVVEEDSPIDAPKKDQNGGQG
jgi:uncharacterized LabA/DUF88 family protein